MRALATLAAALLLPAAALAQPVTIAGSVTSVAANTPTHVDAAIVLATVPQCPAEAANPALITRWTIGIVPPRVLMSANPSRPPGTCNPYQLASNVHVDGDTLFWVDNQGPGGSFVLWRKSRFANAADPATLLVDYGTTLTGAELITFTSSIFVILHRTGQNDVMWQHDKDTGAYINVNVTSGAPSQLSSMQVDSRYLYWLNAGALWRNDLTNGAQVTIATGVLSYYDEGYSEDCSPLGCTQLARVLYGKQNQILNRYNLDPPFPVYTAADTAATIPAITRDGTKYYFFERRPVPGGGFDRNDYLYRLPVGNTIPALLYGPINNGGPGFDSLHTDLTWIYFRNRQTRELQRIANDAAAIPVYALRAKSIEITQGVQTPTNSVALVQGRRTFVRFHVQSDGATNVANVEALLTVFDPDTQQLLGTLRPNNRDGVIVVDRTPWRRLLADSFYFEVPLEWTRRSRLVFTATVNPASILLENTYADNAIQTGAYELAAPTRLPLHVVSFMYNFNNQFITPGGLEDWNSLRWIERVYPLPTSGGSITQPGDGLRTDSTAIVDDELASRVARTHADCAPLLIAATATSPAVDNRQECAGNYVLARIRAMRTAGDLPRGRFYYGSIAGRSGVTPFTRGFAPANETIAVGPSKDPSVEQNYMAHEVGHLLGRGHPASGAAPVCTNQDANDPGFPHPQANIGNSTTAPGDDLAAMGFDFGDNRFVTPVLKAASTTNDFMSYCTPYWSSDYTYVGIHDFLTSLPPGGPTGGGGAGGAGAGDPLVPGDWLIANGSLSLLERRAVLSVVQRREAVAEETPATAGAWQLELRNVGGALLASHPFTPEPIADEPTSATFSLAVPFVPGTRELRIVEIAGGAVAAAKFVSASPPVVSNVGLIGAPDPVVGTVTASWTASDPDGGALRFDVLRTRDDGETFEPVALSIPTPSVDLDTSTWGGGTTRLRVVASDGMHTDVADGAPFEVADKAPVVRIASPGDGVALDWGQVVNLVATIEDAQDAPIDDADVVWSNAYRVLGTGRSLAVDDLEVGVNPITVTATNAAGLSGDATVNVLVGDDLTLPGPRVSALPATIDLSVAGAETETQNATLDVVNAGGGVLAYLASSSADWLTVDGTSSTTGTAPQTIAVAIDPSALPDASVSIAEILVYNALDLDDVLSIPVTVAKGDVVGGVAFVDSDGDEIDDRDDDCPLVANAGQEDADADGVGDACETLCTNGLDDDGDGLADFPDDPGCQNEGTPIENPKCDDDLDNDGDGKIDWDGGASAAAPDPQCVGKPWRTKEGSSCGVGAELALLLPLLGRLASRRLGGRAPQREG